MPAEWEPQEAVLLAWPHKNTDWNYMLEEVQNCYVSLIKIISKYAKVVVLCPVDEQAPLLSEVLNERVIRVDAETNDTWIRDYGIITTLTDDGNKRILNDFGYNAWGGKFKYNLDNEVNRHLYNVKLLSGCFKQHKDFILEGGSIESDGQGTIMTTTSCLLTPTRNANMTRQQIESRLCDTLGASKILWLEHGEIIGDDTDGHIDTIARFAPGNTILFCGNSWLPADDIQAHALRDVKESLEKFTSVDGKPYNLIELPMPSAIYDSDDGHRLPATYANFLILNNAVLLPVYGQPQNDHHAELVLKVAFPNHDIVPVDCRALIRQHGSLHCATMQIPNGIIPF